MSYRVAFIGSGGRAVAFGRPYVESDDIDVVALADPQPDHRALFIERTGASEKDLVQYDNWPQMLEDHGSDLDGVVIASPNHLHAEHCVPCLERGLPVALEKPLATTPDDCHRILDAERANNGRTLLGFVLRSTPFYSKIHELIASDVIGRVTSIQADELPGFAVSSIMQRSPWRRYARTSGGSMLEKCCHDMDILNWMMNSRPAALDSFGGRLIFNANASLPEICDGCPVGDSCNYFMAPAASAHEDQAEGAFHKYTREDNRCVFNIDKDNLDVQSVSLQYENGGIVNFMLNFNVVGPRASRNFMAIGQRGQIWGNLHEAKVYHHDNLTKQVQEFDCKGDGSGHGGGDRLHALQLRRMMAEPDFVPQANASAGYLSAMMCFASDLSCAQHRRVHFRYEDAYRVVID